jgi:phytoene dehydrogenase-like protein
VSKPFHVLIIGGGVGGLTLAQGLKRSGISAAVYERDRTPTDRLQGYRVHISPTGSAGLHECLSPESFDVFDRTCGSPNTAVRFFTEQMRELLSFERELVQPTDPIACHRSASRITLRQVLLSGLDNVQFGKTFSRYEEQAIRSSLTSRTAHRRAATSWSQPMAAARVCGGNFSRTPSVSKPVSPPSPARSFSTRREIASRDRCSTGSASSPPAAATACSSPSRR